MASPAMDGNRVTSAHMAGTGASMTDSNLPPTDDTTLRNDDDTLPAEHPAGVDTAVSAGEALSGEGLGTAAGSLTPTVGDAAGEVDDSQRTPDSDT